MPDAYDKLDDAWTVAIKAASWSIIVPIALIVLLAAPAWVIPWATAAIGFGTGVAVALTYVSRGIAGDAEVLKADESEKTSERDRYA